MKKMKSLLKYMVFAVVVGLLFVGFDAVAATGTSGGSTGVFNHAAKLLGTTFKNVRMIVYVLGAFGLIGIAVAGILGKVPFKWLAMLAIGLAIVAAADGIVRYAIQNTASNQAEGVGYASYDLGSK